MLNIHPIAGLLSLSLCLGGSAVLAHRLDRRSTTDYTALAGKSFDFVVVGGGTAGLAIAARLAEWDNITVAVVEAGTDGSEYADQIDIPGMFSIIPFKHFNDVRPIVFTRNVIFGRFDRNFF